MISVNEAIMDQSTENLTHFQTSSTYIEISQTTLKLDKCISDNKHIPFLVYIFIFM